MIFLYAYLGCEAAIFLLVARLYVMHVRQERRAAAVPVRGDDR